jgi:hypothetical protein
MRTDTHHHIRDAVARAVGIIGLLGIGLIHLLDSIGKYGETRYIFWMYIALIVGSIAVAGLLLYRGGRLAWGAAGVLALSAIAGFVLSRTTGLPSAKGDVGNWTEPLGLASLFVEGCLVALSAFEVLRPRPATAAPADRRERSFNERQVAAGARF